MNDERMNGIEKFVRSDLLDILRDEAAGAKTVFHDADKVHFFGTHRQKIKEFEFLTGEKIIIKEIAAYVKKAVVRVVSTKNYQNSNQLKVLESHERIRVNCVWESFSLSKTRENVHLNSK